MQLGNETKRKKKGIEEYTQRTEFISKILIFCLCFLAPQGDRTQEADTQKEDTRVDGGGDGVSNETMGKLVAIYIVPDNLI